MTTAGTAALLTLGVLDAWSVFKANIPVLIFLVVLVGAKYEANLAVFPAITIIHFGPKNFVMNYGIVYTTWGLGRFKLSQLASAISDATGCYNNAYY